MEAEEKEEAVSRSPSSSSSCSSSFDGFLRHLPTSPFTGLGLAIGLSFLTSTTLISARPPKPLSVAIKLASSAITGTKALHLLDSPESLLFASKSLVKGYKVSKRLNLIQPNNSNNLFTLSTVVKTMKPCLGAISIVRYVTSPVQDFGFLGFGLLSYGYKFSKNFFKVLKGVGGFEMGVALKNGFDSLGLVVKAVRVAKELGQIRGSSGKSTSSTSSFSFCGYGGASDGDYGNGLVVDVGCGIGCEKRLSLSPVDCFSSFCEAGSGIDFVVAGSERLRGVWVSELLCLSIPIKNNGCVL